VLSLIARKGSPAPDKPIGDIPDAVFSQFTSEPVLNDNRDVAFSALLADDPTVPGTTVTTSNDEGIWGRVPLRLVVREGDPAPAVGTNISIFSIRPPVINTNRDIAFVTTLSGNVTPGINDRVLWMDLGSGGLIPVARSGDPAPGAPPGTIFSGFGDPLITDNGDVVFVAHLASTGGLYSEGVWRIDSGGSATLVSLASKPAPGTDGEKFSSYYPPSANQYGDVAFLGRLDTASPDVNPENYEGIWGPGTSPDLGPHSLSLIARTGDPFELPLAGPSTYFFLQLATPSGNQDGRRSALGEDDNVTFWASFWGGPEAILQSRPLTVIAVDDTAVLDEDDPATTIDVLNNDINTTGGLFSIDSVTQPANGAVVMTNGGADLTYQPDPDYCNDGSPTDDFTYTLTPEGTTATVAVTVNCIDDPPVAVDDVLTIDEDSGLVLVDILANDTDVDGGPIDFSLLTQPAHGVAGHVSTAEGPKLGYEPDVNFCNDGNPTDDFTYQLAPGGSTATVSVTVNCVNDPPVATDEQYELEVIEQVSGNVITDDTGYGVDYDVEGDPLTAALVTDVAHGVLVLNPDGSFSYDPGDNNCNEDFFTYVANDGQADSEPAEVLFDIFCRPVATDNAYTINENSQASGNVITDDTGAGVDSYPDGSPLTAILWSDVSHGTLVLNPDGSFTYDPDVDYCNDGDPVDTFTYRAIGQDQNSNTATVSLTVNCVNDPPVATDDLYSTDEDTQASGNVITDDTGAGADSDADGDPLTASLVSDVGHGTLSLNPDGSFTYDPDADYCNDGDPVDVFTYRVNDGEADSNTATVSLSVNCVNDPPVATDDLYSTDEDTQASGNVITDDTGAGADSDADGDPLTASLVSDVGHGTLSLNPDGSFTYDPDADYCNDGDPVDVFTYRVNDGEADSNMATVSLTVNCTNDLPVVTHVDIASQTSDYSDFIATVTITATDADDTAISLAETGEPPASAGSLALSAASCTPVGEGSSCTWTYDGQVLDPGDNVYDIVFTASDGEGAGPVTGTHTLTVQPEDAAVMLDVDNEVAVEVPEPDADSGPFELYFSAWEFNSPDDPHGGSAEFGDLNRMVPFMTLVPVGPGSPVDADSCVFIPPLPEYPGEGYGQEAVFECTFDQVSVNTYEVVAAVDGSDGTHRYFVGADDDVLTVFDPSLGFTTGAGWFYWPGTEDPGFEACGLDGYPGDKTNIGFNMKFNKKRNKTQGSLLLMRHTVDADCQNAGSYKVKSNALEGLAVSDGVDADGPYGWASFGGKAGFQEPGFDTEGNYTFLVYTEDHGESGCNQVVHDEFWIQVLDHDGISVLEINGPNSDPAGPDESTDGDDEPIVCGDIVVPHKTGSGAGGGGGKKNHSKP
jgi:VCBS repeat-containing protein